MGGVTLSASFRVNSYDEYKLTTLKKKKRESIRVISTLVKVTGISRACKPL